MREGDDAMFFGQHRFGGVEVDLAVGGQRHGVDLVAGELPWRQQAFLSWAGLRGAVPIVLATIPMNARVPGATRLFDIVFIIVVINTAVQGPTLPWAARRLKVIAPAEPLDVDVEAAPLEALHADLLQAQIPPGPGCTGWRSSSCGCPPRPASR